VAQEEPIIEAREWGYGTLIRVFPTYVEVKKVWGGTKTIPMRQIQGVDVTWANKLIIHAHGDDIKLAMAEAEEVRQAILRNLV
jgi:hypothetical protein